MVIPLTWDDAFTSNNLEDVKQNSNFVPKQIGFAEKSREHGQGYAAPSAQMFLHCVAQHIQVQNSLQAENKAKEISVCTIWLDQSLSVNFLQVFLPESYIRVLLVALEEI